MAYKREEIERTREHFPPAHSFLQSKTKNLIEDSRILEIMKRMPKGAILHAHGYALGDFRWLVSEASYLPNCYVYQGENGETLRGTLRFFAEPPGKEWASIDELRKEAGIGLD